MKTKTIQDINGKIIHINDVIVIHEIICHDGKELPAESKLLHSEIGIVTSFGCVEVEIARDPLVTEFKGPWKKGSSNMSTLIYIDEKGVEVIGKL